MSYRETHCSIERHRTAIVVEATYEDGVLKLATPLPLPEHEKVRMTVETAMSPILAAYGTIGWTGGAEALEHFALSPELDPEEG